MSVDIEIRQKGLFKKKLSLDDILMNQFHFGSYNFNYILQENQRGEDEITIYHPDHIARGISVSWNENETRIIQLSMLTPTTHYEIDDLYMLVEHLCYLWKTNVFTQDGREYTLDDIKSVKKNIKAFNYNTLKMFVNDHEVGNFFSAMWPIDFISSEVRHWVEDETLESFAKDLHNNQSQDLYYAGASLYDVNNEDGTQSMMGVYTVTSTVDTIFPLESETPFSCVNFSTGEKIEADFYRVGLFSIEKEELIGMISFEDFKNEISKFELHEFDSKHIWFDGLSEEILEDIVEKNEK